MTCESSRILQCRSLLEQKYVGLISSSRRDLLYERVLDDCGMYVCVKYSVKFACDLYYNLENDKSEIWAHQQNFQCQRWSPKSQSRNPIGNRNELVNQSMLKLVISESKQVVTVFSGPSSSQSHFFLTRTAPFGSTIKYIFAYTHPTIPVTSLRTFGKQTYR